MPRARRPNRPRAAPCRLPRVRRPGRVAAGGARRVLGPQRRRRRRRPRRAAGGALEPVPAVPVRCAGRGHRHPGQSPDRARLRRPLLLGHRDLRPAVPVLHRAADRQEPPALPLQHAAQGPPARRGAQPGGGAVPMADHQRRGGVGVLPGRHGAVPPQRRHRLRPQALRRRHRGHRCARRVRCRAARGDGPAVGGPRLLRQRRCVPSPRGHRSRRVHDGGQRQRLHQPDGAAEPQLRGPRPGAPARDRSRPVRRAVQRRRPAQRGDRRVAPRGTGDARPL